LRSIKAAPPKIAVIMIWPSQTALRCAARKLAAPQDPRDHGLTVVKQRRS